MSQHNEAISPISPSEATAVRNSIASDIIAAMRPTPFNLPPSNYKQLSPHIKQLWHKARVLDTVDLDRRAVVEVQSKLGLKYLRILRPDISADLDQPDPDDVYERVHMSIEALVGEVCDPDTSRRLNGLSIPTHRLLPDADNIHRYTIQLVSAVSYSDQVLIRLVSDDTRAYGSYYTSSEAQQTKLPDNSGLPNFGFYIISSSGTIHDPHFDAGGFRTIIGSLSGYKVFLLAQGHGVFDTAPVRGEDPWELMDREDLVISLIVLCPGDYL